MSKMQLMSTVSHTALIMATREMNAAQNKRLFERLNAAPRGKKKRNQRKRK